MRKLPIWDITKLAYGFLVNDFGTIVRLTWLATLIVCALEYVTSLAIIESLRPAMESGNIDALAGIQGGSWWNFLNLVVQMLGTAIVAVALHRVILFGERAPGRIAYLAFGKVELLFVLLPLIVGLACVLPMILVFSALYLTQSTGLFALLTAAVGLLAIFVFVRTSLVLPMAVVTRRFQFKESWNLTRGNFWRLFLTWIVVFLPMLLVVMVLQTLIMPDMVKLMSGEGHKAKAIVDALSFIQLPLAISQFIFMIIGGALGVAILSYSYKYLSGAQPEDVLTRQA